MTSDYKDRVLDFICGTLNEEIGNNNLTITDDYTLASSGSPSSNIIKLKDSNGNYNGLLMSYYLSEMSGYLITDYYGNTVAAITEYSSGVAIDSFAEIYVEDDGTLFVITNNDSSAPSYPGRILMLNNPSVKNNQGQYEIRIKKSYNITSYLPEAYTIWNITKSPNESLYAVSIQQQYIESGKLYTNSGLLTCRIQVGAENEYNTYYGALLENSSFIPYLDSIVKFDKDGNIDYKVMLVNNYILASNHNIYVYHKTYTSDTLTLTNTISNSSDVYVDALFYDDNTAYGIYSDSNSYYAKFDFNNNTRTNIEKIANGYLDNLDKTFKIDNLMVLPIYDETLNKCYLYIFKGDTRLAKKEYLSVYSSQAQTHFINHLLTNTYNLFNIISYTGQSAILNQFVYNNNRYNGSSYKSYKMYSPDSAILKDDNKIVFARDLYNRITQQNTITSTIEIPYSELNEDTIQQSNLIGMNNNVIDSDNQMIQKNIYENVLINFNDTYTIINKNNNANIINDTSSVQLVNALLDINTPGYGNKSLTKYRIIYGDDSNVVSELPVPTIDTVNRIATYEMILGTYKDINRIEFISNDESITYLIITLNVEANKIFKITQKVRVI